MAAPTPIRPAEEVVGAYLPITLGGKGFSLAELPRRANREWQALVADEVRKALSDSGPLETADEVIEAIAGAAELMMDLLIAYDDAGAKAYGRDTVLPTREWIDTTATDRECYEAIKKVTAASYPFGADLMVLFPELRPELLQAVSRGAAAATVALVTSSKSTSSARRSTAGRRTSSKRTSPTPS